MNDHDPRSNIVHRDGVYELFVDSKPFLILGGQLAASSTSSAAYISRFWEKLRDTGANTIFAPVSWGVIEPVEASYDFSALDALIAQSNANGLRVVIQWFGSLKGDSTDSKLLPFHLVLSAIVRMLEMDCPFRPPSLSPKPGNFISLCCVSFSIWGPRILLELLKH